MNTFNNKAILVVGATGGLAKETLKHLINDGASNVTITGRTLEKVNFVKKELESVAKRPIKIKTLGGFDMLDPNKIKASVATITTSFDIVFLAAGGVFFSDDYEFKEWNGKRIEKTVFQNLFGSHVVLQALRKNKLINANARIIIAGGEGARGIPGMIAKPEFKSKEALRNYIFNPTSYASKYNPMNAIGVSKLYGAIWIAKLADTYADEFSSIWFTPGLTSGTNGLSGLPPVKQWFAKNIVFKLLNVLGKAQNASQGGRKFADCIENKIGANGAVLGAPKGKTLGKITNQKPMNDAFTNTHLKEELWLILTELFGEF